MEIIRESLRLRHETGPSQRNAAASLGISHSTVCRTLQHGGKYPAHWSRRSSNSAAGDDTTSRQWQSRPTYAPKTLHPC